MQIRDDRQMCMYFLLFIRIRFVYDNLPDFFFLIKLNKEKWCTILCRILTFCFYTSKSFWISRKLHKKISCYLFDFWRYFFLKKLTKIGQKTKNLRKRAKKNKKRYLHWMLNETFPNEKSKKHYRRTPTPFANSWF